MKLEQTAAPDLQKFEVCDMCNKIFLPPLIFELAPKQGLPPFLLPLYFQNPKSSSPLLKGGCLLCSPNSNMNLTQHIKFVALILT